MSAKVKRSCEEVVPPNAKCFIFDIEGTTTSISFVKDTLFPYIRSNLVSYIVKQWNTDEFKADLTLLKEQAVKDEADKVEGCVSIPTKGDEAALQDAIAANVLWQMDADRKTKALKQLQGHIMREGYKEGELKGHLYPDVAPALQAWTEKGYKLYIYSSGSVEAQKLLFGHSEQGDLLKLFHGHFDTEVGPKGDVASYINILKHLDCEPGDVVFFTDIPAEAKAAEGAGMTAVLVVREGNGLLTEEDRALYQVIESFATFESLSSLKRRKFVDDAEICADVEMTDVSEAPTSVSPVVPEVSEAIKDEAKPALVSEPLDVVMSVPEVHKSQANGVEEVESHAMETTDIETSTPDDEKNIPVETLGKTDPAQVKEELPITEVKESKINTIEITENGEKAVKAIDVIIDVKESSASGETDKSAEHAIAVVEVPNVTKGPVSEPVEVQEALVENTKVEEKVKKEPTIEESTNNDEVSPIVVKDSEETIAIPLKIDLEEAMLPKPVANAAGDVIEPGLKTVKTVKKETTPEKEKPGEVQLEVNKTKVVEIVKRDETGKKSSDLKAIEVKEEEEVNTNVKEIINEDKKIVIEIKEVVKTEVDAKVKEEEVIVLNVKDVVEEKEVLKAIDEKKEVIVDESMQIAKDSGEIENATLSCEIEENGVSESANEKLEDIVDQADILGQIDIESANVEAKTIPEEAVEGKISENKVSEAAVIDNEKETYNMEFSDRLTDKISEETDILDTKIPKEESTVTKNGVVEMGQGDASTLIEVSKNVENGKDTIQADEIKVKKVLVDDTSDNAENAVPVAMET